MFSETLSMTSGASLENAKSLKTRGLEITYPLSKDPGVSITLFHLI
jgi:hypothetical protein